MPSKIDICNLALAHLGDEATYSSIAPPEGSAQAEHCARFYPVARDALLEAHAWTFATTRARSRRRRTRPAGWLYAYARPNESMCLLAVLDSSSVRRHGHARIHVRNLGDNRRADHPDQYRKRGSVLHIPAGRSGYLSADVR